MAISQELLLASKKENWIQKICQFFPKSSSNIFRAAVLSRRRSCLSMPIANRHIEMLTKSAQWLVLHRLCE